MVGERGKGRVDVSGERGCPGDSNSWGLVEEKCETPRIYKKRDLRGTDAVAPPRTVAHHVAAVPAGLLPPCGLGPRVSHRWRRRGQVQSVLVSLHSSRRRKPVPPRGTKNSCRQKFLKKRGAWRSNQLLPS